MERKRAESEIVKMMVKKWNQMQLLFILRDHVLLLPFLFTLLRQRENKMHLDYRTMTEKGNGEEENERRKKLTWFEGRKCSIGGTRNRVV